MNPQNNKKLFKKTYERPNNNETYKLIENISKSIPEFIEKKVINPYFRHKEQKITKKPTHTQFKNSNYISDSHQNPALKANYAFIDAQNLHQSSKHWGWKLDYDKLRNYLRTEYNVQVAYLFMGFIPDNQEIYNNLQKKGYILVFKETSENMEIVKGNCDVELVLQAMIDYNNFDQAVIVSGDGDFSAMIRHFYQQNKLAALLVPNKSAYSKFLQKTAKERIGYLNLLKTRLADKSFEETIAKVRKSPATKEVKQAEPIQEDVVAQPKIQKARTAPRIARQQPDKQLSPQVNIHLD